MNTGLPTPTVGLGYDTHTGPFVGGVLLTLSFTLHFTDCLTEQSEYPFCSICDDEGESEGEDEFENDDREILSSPSASSSASFVCKCPVDTMIDLLACILQISFFHFVRKHKTNSASLAYLVVSGEDSYILFSCKHMNRDS